MKILTETQKIECQQMTQNELDNKLNIASLHGDIEIVRYLLTSLDVKYRANMSSKYGEALVSACYHGNIEIIKYLLSSSELKEHADIHVNNDEPLQYVIRYNAHYLKLVKYLLTSPELKEHANIHVDNDCIFINICNGDKTKYKIKLLEYLIFDYRIEKTKHIEYYLLQNKEEAILKMFNQRELEEKLQLDLQDKIQTNIITKIKL